MKRITIYDVAKEAGVSLATVSRVINGAEIVREDTRAKVQAAIEQLGYKPNAIAQGLALSKTTTIAFVVPETSFFYTGQIINGLLDVAKIYKYNIVLHTTTEGISKTSDIIESIIKSRVDGVIIFNDKLPMNELETLTSYQVPIMVIGDKVSKENMCSVYVDFEQLIFEYVSDYLERGIKDIALIDDRKNISNIQELNDGIENAYKKYKVNGYHFIKVPKEYRSSYQYLKEYFKTHKHELVIAYRDSQAVAVLNACHENGIKIPEECELVCVLDSKYNQMVRPRISGFKIPDYDVGAVAMRIMTKMLVENNEEEYNKETELSYIYVPRETTK